MRSRIVRWGLAAITVATLAACGSDSSSTSDTTAAAPSTPGTSVTAGAPTGTAVISAAAASPATTNTAQNPAQAFGLIAGVGAAPVTIQSPPVINFTVIDSTGKFVPGLKLFDAAGAKADPACAGNNVTAAIAKFDGSNWQSLISYQRLDADTTTPAVKYAVVEGTTDPKPTATLTNPTTAASDPSTRVVGILEENTTGGYYTYRFAIDVSTPLLLKDAVAGRNIASSAATSTAPAYPRRVANNGNVAAKDGKTVHRVGLQLCYTDPSSKAKVTVNPTIDFTLGADGVAVPVKSTDGKSLARASAVVDVANCNECHEKLAAHGNILTGNPRVNSDYCVICHNVGSKDYNNQSASADVNASGSISFKSMIHKLHGGKNVLTKDYQVASLVFRKASTDTTAVSTSNPKGAITTGTAFPQDVRNCTKCHDNAKAAQADNWKTVPTRLACGSCHDGIDFSTGKGYQLGEYNYTTNTAPTASVGHIGGAKKDDTQCLLCHDATTIPVYHQTVVASAHNPTVKSGVASFQYKITGATINASRQLVVSFQILKDGVAQKLATGTTQIAGFTGGPSFLAIYATAQDGIAAPSDWNSGHDSVTLADAVNQANGNTITVDTAGTTYTLTMVKSGGTSGHSLTLPADAKMVTAMIAGTFTQTGVTERSGALPGIPAMLAATGNTPDGKPNVARRVIFKEDACNACHDRLGTEPNFHSGSYSIAMCAACHTPIQGGTTGWSASFRVWVHGIHSAEKRTIPFTWHAVNKSNNYSQVGYPGVLKNCETCHLPGTYDFTGSAYTADVLNGMLPVTATASSYSTTTKQMAPASASTTSYVFPQAAPVGSGKWAYGAALKLYAGSGSFAVDTDFGPGYTLDKSGTATNGTVIANTNTVPGSTKTVADNLVSSPITAVCSTCHDDTAALTHMTSSGFGSFYRPRGTAGVTNLSTALGSIGEQCLTCHGAGKVLPIKTVHNPAWDTTVSPVTSPW